VRHQSVVALVSSHKKIRPEDYGKVLMRGAGDEDPRVRADSARGFRHLGLERATDPLVGLIKDQDGRVRANALNSLAQLWKKSGAPMTSLSPKVSFLLEDSSNRVVADAAIALSEADPRRVREAIIRLVHSHSPLHIASGIYAASKVCPEVLTQNFDRLIALPHKPVQEALRKYFKYGDAEATGILKAGKSA
jgi:HEAT repeat protein